MSRSEAEDACVTIEPDRGAPSSVARARDILDGMRHAPAATLRPQWVRAEAPDVPAPELVLALGAQLDAVARSASALARARTPAEARVGLWRARKLERLCAELAEELKADADPSRELPLNDHGLLSASLAHRREGLHLAIAAIDELRSRYGAEGAVLASRIAVAPASRRKTRSASRNVLLAELVGVFEIFWTSPAVEPLEHGSSANPLHRFLELAMAAVTGKPESRRSLAKSLASAGQA